MKKILVIFTSFFMTVLHSVVEASSIKTDSSSVYEVTYQKHAAGVYNSPLSYAVFGIILVVLIVLGYFYWKNGMRND